MHIQKHTLKTKEKMRLAKLGTKQSFETIEKRRMALLGKKRPKRSQEWCDNLSKSCKRRKAWNEGLKGCYKQSKESNEKRSKALKGHIVTNETSNKIRISNTGKKRTIESRMKMVLSHLGKSNGPHTRKTKAKQSYSAKKLWENEEYKEMRLKNLFKLKSHKQNLQEKLLEDLIQKAIPGEYIYSGNGKVFIDRKCPDWFNVNGKKKLIEYFGNYWHGEKRTGRTKEQEENKRREVFSKYGFQTLFIWESELNDLNRIINKIKEFTYVSN